jgi:hypothetical protein
MGSLPDAVGTVLIGVPIGDVAGFELSGCGAAARSSHQAMIGSASAS